LVNPNFINARVVGDHAFLRQEYYGFLDFVYVFLCVNSKIAGVKFPNPILQTVADREYQGVKTESFAIEDSEVLRIIKVHRLDDHRDRPAATVGENIDAVRFQVPSPNVSAEIDGEVRRRAGRVLRVAHVS